MRFLKWRIPPSMIVTSVALSFVVAVSLTSFAQRIGVLDPHVFIYPVAGEEERAERAMRTPLTSPAMDGEVIRTTERLREMSALTTALVLYVAHERMEGRKLNTVSELLAEIEREGLMPPGVRREAQAGVCTTTHRSVTGETVAHGNLFVRYRPQPIGIEVVSVGIEQRDGPSLMMRVPEDLANGGAGEEGATFFMATRLDEVKVPRAFADESEVISGGWSRESLRAVKVSQNEQQSLRDWAGKRAF